VEKASQNILAFIHFQMIQGIQRSSNSDMVITDDHIQYFLSAFKLEKNSISKNLLKSIFWALTLSHSKILLSKKYDIDTLKMSSENGKLVAKVAEGLVNAEDKSLGNTAREVMKFCKNGQ